MSTVAIAVLVLTLLGSSFGQFQSQVAPQPRQITKYSDIVNLRLENVNPGDGTYHYSYENSDGTSVYEKGYQKPAPPGSDDDQAVFAKEGGYQYYSPESGSAPVKITYVADENGYQPVGEHLPTPPPIPDHVVQLLKLIFQNAEEQRAAGFNFKRDARF